MTEKYRKMDETYNEVCQMFGEDGKKIEPSDFFKILHDFVSIYFVSTVNNMKSIFTAIRELKIYDAAFKIKAFFMQNKKNE